MAARIASLNISAGGVPKRPVAEARVTVAGLEGDRQRDRRHHGGPDRALCLYSLECLDALRAEGHDVSPGSLGENVTVAGLAWDVVQPGVRLALGDVSIEITAFASPCKTIRGAFADENFTRVSQKARGGWSRVYARVLGGGVLRAGDGVTIVSAPTP